MELLDNLLTTAADPKMLKTDLSQKVMARIRIRKLRRNILIAGSLAIVATAAVALLRGHLGQMLGYAIKNTSVVKGHPALFARSVIESIPLPIVLAALILAGFAVYAKRTKVPERLVRATVGLSVAAFALTGSTAAFAFSTASSTLAPAQQELERTVNGVGQTDVVIDGKTYEFNSGLGLTNDQILAQVESQTLYEETKNFDLEGASDGGTVLCSCSVISSTATSVTYTWGDANAPQTPMVAAITSASHFYLGAKPSAPFTLVPGETITIGRSVDQKRATVISRPGYPEANYYWAGNITDSPAHHRTDGRCYNNTDDLCPNLPASYDYLPITSEVVPAGAVVREVYGKIVQFSTDQFELKTSSGTVWTFVVGDVISHANETGFYDGPDIPLDHSLVTGTGDYIRVEFWQMPNDLKNRTVLGFDVNAPTTKQDAMARIAAGTYDPYKFKSQIRMIQLALNSTWYQGSVPDKVK